MMGELLRLQALKGHIESHEETGEGSSIKEGIIRAAGSQHREQIRDGEPLSSNGQIVTSGS